MLLSSFKTSNREVNCTHVHKTGVMIFGDSVHKPQKNIIHKMFDISNTIVIHSCQVNKTTSHHNFKHHRRHNNYATITSTAHRACLNRRKLPAVMAAILHVTKAGHKCHKPAMITTPASYIKAGDVIGIGGWALSYHNRRRAYIVHRDVAAYGQYDYYEFSNYNCAAAKLVELGTSN